jgi:hypothetical protein
MKKIVLGTLISLLTVVNVFTQEHKFDGSSGLEFIFGSAEVKGTAAGTNLGALDPKYQTTITEGMNQPVRFTMFLHIQQFIHYNMSKNVGLFTGVTLRNVGFIVADGDFTSKYRTYTAGIPLAIKLGDMDKHFNFYFGAEAGFAFNYKEKHFRGSTRESMTTEWFSGRTNWFQPQLFAGVQLPYGGNLKVAYYPQNFFNTSYREPGTSDYKPYEGVEANLFYVSLSFQLFSSDHNKETTAAQPANRTARL